MNQPSQGPQIALDAIGVSVWRLLSRLHDSSLASLRLALTFHMWYQQHKSGLSTASDSESASSILSSLQGIDPSAIHALGQDRKKYILLASIGVFDSFLSDTLRFYFSHRPSSISSALSQKAAAKLAERSPTERAEEVVRRNMRSWKSRYDFLCKNFEVKIKQDTEDELARLIALRNEVAHHTGLYDFVIEPNDRAVYATPRPIPEVSTKDSALAPMLVAEVTDQLLVAISQRLFNEAPSLRPLTPEIEAAYAAQRTRLEEEDKEEASTEDVPDPHWRTIKAPNSDLVYVGERTANLMFTPTGIEQVPALISCRRNNRHGMSASARIDGGPARELLGQGKELLGELIVGKELVVEFYEEPWEKPRRARYLLNGFADAWQRAWEQRVALGLPTSAETGE